MTNEITKFLNNFYWILNQIMEMETDNHSNIPLCGFSSQNFTIFYEILVQNFKYGNFDLIYPSDEFATRTLKYWNNMKKSRRIFKNLKKSSWRSRNEISIQTLHINIWINIIYIRFWSSFSIVKTADFTPKILALGRNKTGNL